MSKVFFKTILCAGLLVTACSGGATFVDEFDGTAVDPDPAKWYPNERSSAFDNYLQDGVLHMDCIGGGADNPGLRISHKHWSTIGRQNADREAWCPGHHGVRARTLS